MIDRVAGLAGLLLAARLEGRPLEGIPAEFVPRSGDEACAVQDATVAALGTVGGWKVGASSPTAEPSAAPLLGAVIRADPAQWELPKGASVGIEGELAFRFARPLLPRAEPYGEDEVWDAIDALHPAIELVQSRFADPQAMDKLALLADNLANYGFCYGAAVPDWRHIDFLRQPVSLIIDGAERARAVGGNAAGHPRRLLVWLANHCVQRGRGLAAGQIVTTGTHTGLATLTAPAEVVVRFADVGEARLTLAA
jgi:2-keto-4-pentenoate hydratase